MSLHRSEEVDQEAKWAGDRPESGGEDEPEDRPEPVPRVDLAQPGQNKGHDGRRYHPQVRGVLECGQEVDGEEPNQSMIMDWPAWQNLVGLELDVAQLLKDLTEPKE